MHMLAAAVAVVVLTVVARTLMVVADSRGWNCRHSAFLMRLWDGRKLKGLARMYRETAP